MEQPPTELPTLPDRREELTQPADLLAEFRRARALGLGPVSFTHLTLATN